MIARFFIDRPIFAAVLSIVITLAGGVALATLPLAMYPQIAPPTVQVDCKYPGASAREVAETVASPIEQAVNGVEGMLYMSSQCTNDGSYNLTVTFQNGMDLNMAQVLVQNRVALALPLLPEVIKQAGVTARKRSPDILMAIAINSPIGRYDNLYLSNYGSLHLRDELLRVPGVSDISMLGQQDYSMRVWVDPEKLASRNLTAADIVRSLREQNDQVAAGQIGQPPVPDGQPIQITLDTLGRLTEPEQFEQVVVKVGPRGQLVRLKDVARVELAPKSRDVTTKVNGRPSASLAIFLLPDANALETGDLVKARIAEMAKDFPDGLRYEIRYDTTPFIRESIDEVFKTLRDAVILVALVVLLFLQNWRSAIIPLVAVPVAIIGTFAVMAALGFSLNNLTLFGLVLAIGIVVDDAIVVVEAVEHHMDQGLPPREATIRAMEEVSGPVIAIGLVLTAVFVPCAFISGIVGQFFRQFALTIAASTLISTFNSLTLSPALAALLLKPKRHGDHGRPEAPLPRLGIALLFAWLGYVLAGTEVAPVLAGWGLPLPEEASWVGAIVAGILGALVGFAAAGLVNWLLGWLFAAFNGAFRWATGRYVRSVGLLLRGMIGVLLVYGGMLYLTYDGFMTTPSGFIPSQDMGYLLVNVQLPDAASLERSQAVMNRLETIAHEVPGVKHTQTMTGQSILLSAFGSNFGSMFIILDEFAKRPNTFRDRFWRWMDKRMLPRASDLRFWAERQPPGPQDKPLSALATSALEKLAAFENRNGLPESLRLSKRWSRPKGQSLYGEAIADELRKRYARDVPEATITVLGPPPLRGVGRAGGFKLMVEDRGSALGLPQLQAQTENLTEAAKKRTELVGLTSVFRANVPQLFVDVDRAECMSKRVLPQDLFSTLQVYLGSLYVNDFNLFSRTWQVIVQSDSNFRNNPEDVRRLKVRNLDGRMVPIGALAKIREINGPLILTRYNMYTSAPINGSAAPGISSGAAIDIMEELAERELPPSMAIEWTELAYLELQAGNTAMLIFGFAVVMVFLVLAAQYESWALPLAVILTVPLCLLFGVAGVNAADEDINIFTQIGFVVLVGLACKNAILIVEFARGQRMLGKSRREAALDACGLRLRPIIMTSLAFILGTVPLLMANGAGSEMRRTLGTTVFSGMLGVTIFGILLTPVFFVLVDWLASSALFRSRPVRWISGAALFVLGLFSLGGLWRVLRTLVDQARSLRRRARPATGRPASVGGSGHGRPPARTDRVRAAAETTPGEDHSGAIAAEPAATNGHTHNGKPSAPVGPLTD